MAGEEISLGRLRYAMKKGKNSEVYAILEKYGVDAEYRDLGTALSLACIFQNWEIAKFCIENGANVNTVDGSSDSPLIATCKAGNFDIASLLIKNGAEINFKNKYDRTPIARAISDHPENLKLIELLLKNGADPFICKEYGQDDPRIETRTAYDYAVKEIGDKKLISLLDKYKQ